MAERFRMLTLNSDGYLEEIREVGTAVVYVGTKVVLSGLKVVPLRELQSFDPSLPKPFDSYEDAEAGTLRPEYLDMEGRSRQGKPIDWVWCEPIEGL